MAQRADHPIATFSCEAYSEAQLGIHHLKQAVIQLLQIHPDGLKGSEIGKMLGIRVEGLGDNGGWISWIIVKLLEEDGALIQNESSGTYSLSLPKPHKISQVRHKPKGTG